MQSITMFFDELAGASSLKPISGSDVEGAIRVMIRSLSDDLGGKEVSVITHGGYAGGCAPVMVAGKEVGVLQFGVTDMRSTLVFTPTS